ncbi:Abi family protein [Curtobacterium sp. ISL-83]|uniref:Abi family protein n=1 Tax=Curtobacterium sp. ISL-83 TaxID=2819145 RepID=UPI001BE67793|nr:Abi family protein [Curtobacterium sp. ISL-83]MBT2502230.1 Abi family protein [Curtobacterium sp. ISL-83]
MRTNGKWVGETGNPPLSEGFPGYARRSEPDASDTQNTAPDAPRQQAVERLLGDARLSTYLAASGGDRGRAAELYLWANQLGGALHAQIAFVEVAVRNAIDARLAAWNSVHGGGPEWTAPGAAAEPLYSLLRRQLIEARTRASREAAQRPATHPRRDLAPGHDDVVAQLMFGSWVRIVRPASRDESPRRQQLLWHRSLRDAFPNTTGEDSARHAIGEQLETLRRLRNRVAHHDNLLQVDARHRLNGTLALLAAIDREYPALAMARSDLRRIIGEDPRKTWSIS